MRKLVRMALDGSVGRHLLAGLGTMLATSAALGQLVDISSTPLFTQQPHPNVTMALSVEFPTAGQAYRGAPPYNPAAEYSGYFNSTKCYTYTAGTPGIFRASSAAAGHKCSNSFSGNFMNWA